MNSRQKNDKKAKKSPLLVKKLLHDRASFFLREFLQKPKIFKVVVIAMLVTIVVAPSYYFFVHVPAVQKAQREAGLPPVPEGWKRYTASAFGITLNTPKAWVVTEINPATSGGGKSRDLGYGLSIYNPDDASGRYTISVAKLSMDASIDQIKQIYSDESVYQTKVHPVKWQGHDAKQVVVSTQQKGLENGQINLLYVQIGAYVFTVPDPDDTPAAVQQGSITKEVYQQFADSIRVDKAAVEQEARLSAESYVLREGKDVTLGPVAVPAGWETKQSKKYGISFAMPADWKVTEQYKSISGIILALTISPPTGRSVVIMVSKSDLDEFTKQASSLYASYGEGIQTKIEKMKWQGYEARRIRVTPEKSSEESVALFVRIGNYTYNIPDADNTQYSAVDGDIDPETLSRFVGTIRIKES